MTDQTDLTDVKIRVRPAISEIPAEAWDACANPEGNIALAKVTDEIKVSDKAPDCSPEDNFELRGYLYNPFVSHDYLSALEASQSAAARTGWQAQHLVAEDGDGRILGAAPCYLKSHSQGEYVFDHGWADAYEQAGGRYYPKLQVCVPFTPATGLAS